MEITLVIKLFIIALFLVGFGFTVYLYIREHTLENIRADVYKLFLKAEHTYTETATGKQKMEYVIQRARSMLPNWAQFFITEELLRKVVQLWFEAVKDLLDDGKVNKSVEE
ncbi:MAG: hypothetical protein IKK59_05495 [Lachnospiraceae bacterium]|nr:hypothetical protein [Lachnospiraceae bacterium]